ncbi:MAG: hypothetical protein MZU91_12160 [Desulfosudis oleivorans]|nr:hypothetical protein [Desulfosudis oleivorans]
MIGCPYGGRCTARQPGGGADDPHRRTALAARAPRAAARWWCVTKPDPALLLGRDPEAPGDRVLPAADGDLPAAGHPGPGQEGRLLVAQVLPVRRGAHVGGEAQAGDRGVRPGDDGRLWPDRGAGVDLLPAAGRAFRRVASSPPTSACRRSASPIRWSASRS